jgi:hypothetical protein
VWASSYMLDSTGNHFSRIYQCGHTFLEEGQRGPSFLGVEVVWALFT